MTLDRLTIRAKKSLSGLFGFGDRKNTPVHEPDRLPNDKNENDPPSLDGFDLHVPDPMKTCNIPPSKDSPSKRKNLMGSLRQRSLRSIGSLRSLRSPTSKTKQVDSGSPTPAEKTRTPKQDLNRSCCMPNFHQSPPGQPMFNLKRNDSISSLEVQHSSPVPIPSTDKHLTPSSVIPDGTIPDSPAPLRKILDQEQAEVSPSPNLITCIDSELTRSAAHGSAPTIISNLESPLSESLKEAAELYCVPISNHDGEPLDAGSIESLIDATDDRHIRAIDNMTAYINRSGLCVDKFCQEMETEAKANPVEEPEENALAILGGNYYARIYRRADGKSRIRIKPISISLDPEDDEYDHTGENSVQIIWARSERDFSTAERMIPSLGDFVAKNEDIAKDKIQDLILKGVVATSQFPESLDVELEWDQKKEVKSRVIKRAKMRIHEDHDVDSPFRKHTGLYDGTGYGRGSSASASRPATAAAETVAPCTGVPGSFPSDEVEISKIEGKL